LSVVAVAVVVGYSGFSLTQALLIAAGMAAGTVAANSLLDKAMSRGETKEIMRRNMRDDIASELRRVQRASGEGPWEEIGDKLGKLKGSIDERFESKEGATEALLELNSIRQEIREAELDSSQCAFRAKSARRLLGELRAAGIATYERELARLDDEIERAAVLPLEERMLALHAVIEQLREMDRHKELASEVDISSLRENRGVRSTSGKAAASDGDMERRRIASEIRDWADRISQMDKSEGEKLRPLIEGLSAGTKFPDRLALIRRQLRGAWGALREKAASTAFFRETLEELMKTLSVSPGALESAEGARLVRRYEALCGGDMDKEAKFIDRVEFMELYEDIAKFAYTRDEDGADAFFVRKVEKTLAEMGYELVSDELDWSEGGGLAALRPDEARYLESPYDGYRAMLKVGSNGAVTTRLVRLEAGDGETLRGADQDVKDREAGEKFCRDLDCFLERMKESGLPLDVTLRKEPGEAEVLAVAGKSKGKADKERRGKRASGARLKENALRGQGDAPR
jgi:hypothetical protein